MSYHNSSIHSRSVNMIAQLCRAVGYDTPPTPNIDQLVADTQYTVKTEICHSVDTQNFGSYIPPNSTTESRRIIQRLSIAEMHRLGRASLQQRVTILAPVLCVAPACEVELERIRCEATMGDLLAMNQTPRRNRWRCGSVRRELTDEEKLEMHQTGKVVAMSSKYANNGEGYRK